MKFSELQLHPLVMAGVEANQYVDCTPIQEAAIPPILSGRDIAGLAQTGTGKTAAFILPLMDRILRAKDRPSVVEQSQALASQENESVRVADGDAAADYSHKAFKNWRKFNFVLVLVPTRELAEQVSENVKKMGKASGLQAVSIYGGTGYEGQKAAIKKGVEFVVATPGRLIDLYKEHELDLSQVRAVVFDEADRMFDMGFKEDMRYILRRVPQDRQFLVFSATLNFDVLNTAYEFGANPIEINVSKDQAKAENVTDEIFHVGIPDKPKFLLSIIQKHKPEQVIVFSNFKHQVERISKFLTENGVPAMGISSLISQSQRTRIMEQFRNTGNNRNILVATDVAARGLDIKGVDMVINFELPDDAENYVHRIGRTGRAGAQGHAFSLVGDRDVEALQRIENYLGHKIGIGWLDDADLVADYKPFRADDGGKKREFRNNEGPRRPSGGGHGDRKTFNKKPRSGPHPQGQKQGSKFSDRKPHKSGEKTHIENAHKSVGSHNNQNKQRPGSPGHQDWQKHKKPSGNNTHKREFYKFKPGQDLKTPPPSAQKPGSKWAGVTKFIKKLFGQ